MTCLQSGGGARNRHTNSYTVLPTYVELLCILISPSENHLLDTNGPDWQKSATSHLYVSHPKRSRFWGRDGGGVEGGVCVCGGGPFIGRDTRKQMPQLYFLFTLQMRKRRKERRKRTRKRRTINDLSLALVQVLLHVLILVMVLFEDSATQHLWLKKHKLSSQEKTLRPHGSCPSFPSRGFCCHLKFFVSECVLESTFIFMF